MAARTCDGGELGLAEYLARGVVRSVEQQHCRARGEGSSQLREVQRPRELAPSSCRRLAAPGGGRGARGEAEWHVAAGAAREQYLRAAEAAEADTSGG